MYDRNHLAARLRGAAPADALFATCAGRPDLSYGALFEGAERIAAGLAALGVRPGDRVAAQVEKSIEAIQLYLGTVLAGGVFLPLNTGYTPAEIEYFVTDAEPAVFVCDPRAEAALAPLAARAGAKTLTLGADGAGSLMDARREAGFEAVARGPDDLAAVLYTSGTTGRSKGAMLSHDNLASNAAALAQCWRFTSADRLIHALPIFHTHGLFVATNVTLMAGASVIFMAKFDPDAVIAAMGDGATVLMGVPTFYTRLLEHPGLSPEAASGMRLFVAGSAPLLAETHRQWSARTGHAVLERYGMTETSMITSNPYDGERRPGAVGFPLPGVAVRVADPETGAELPRGEIGGVEVKGPNVFKGYWRMPEKTAEEFRKDGWFITGDLGMIDADGYLVIVGRSKDMVITGGYNVYPKEIEALIDDLPGVKESAVIGVPHPDFGEGVVAVVAVEPGATVAEAAVMAALEGRLARYKQPKRVILTADLPRNTMGKVQKAALRAEHAALFRKASA
ncbi:MAG: malonate--CoA ligase [Rubrimonas sp.]